MCWRWDCRRRSRFEGVLGRGWGVVVGPGGEWGLRIVCEEAVDGASGLGSATFVICELGSESPQDDRMRGTLSRR